ncbi:MAG: hypothetical protein ITD49_06025 [Candidatus Nitrotoga sp.]|nr:hypothetical protein [Candidatus Nitrotoga sp.]
MLTTNVYASDCIALQGIEFQKVDTYKFLASKNGKNVAFVNVNEGIPEGVVRFRFFSEKLCNSGAASEFQMNGKQTVVYVITIFD